MLDAWGDHPGGAADARRGVGGARPRRRAPDPRRPEGAARPDDQHPAGDADRRSRLLSRLAGRDEGGARRRRRPFARRVQRARRRRRAAASPTRCRWCAFAPRRCRKRCRSAPARWRRSSASTPPRSVAGCTQAARETGEVVQAANFNDPEADRHRRHQGGRRQGVRAAQGGGRQARAAARRVGAVPFGADEARGRAPARAAGDDAAGRTLHPGDRQRRRQERERAGGDPRCAVSPGVRRGPLGRDDPGDSRSRHRPHLRVRPGARARRAWSSGSSPTPSSAAVFDPESLADAAALLR